MERQATRSEARQLEAIDREAGRGGERLSKADEPDSPADGSHSIQPSAAAAGVAESIRAQAELLTGAGLFTLAAVLRWVLAGVLVASVNFGVAKYVLTPPREDVDGSPQDVITVEMTPDPSKETDKPDEVAGQKPEEAVAPTSLQTQADDPEPPAPDAPPPLETKNAPDKAPDLTAPPAPVEPSVALLPRQPEARPSDPDPLVEKMPEIKPPDATVERQTAPSRASTGSAALLSGGKRPSAAAQATWKGEIGAHLGHRRRYPVEARSKGWQGSARVRVTINEEGHVVGSELVQSTGHALLDGEAMALMQRSDPFPKPPAGMPMPVVLTVPVNFAIH